MFSRADELRMSELGDRALPSLTDNERAEYSDLSSRYKQFLDAGVLRLQTLKQLDRPQLYAQPGAVALLASQLPFFSRRGRWWVFLFLLFLFRLVWCFFVFQSLYDTTGAIIPAPSSNRSAGPFSQGASRDAKSSVGVVPVAEQFSLAAFGLSALFAWSVLRFRYALRMLMMGIAGAAELAMFIGSSRRACFSFMDASVVLSSGIGACTIVATNLLCGVLAWRLVVLGAPQTAAVGLATSDSAA